MQTPAGQDLRELSDDALAQLASAVADEQHRRALDGGDVDAIVEQAFLDGFTSTGAARTPYLEHGLLICPGALVAKSQQNHDCTFVSVGEQWAWEHGEKVTSVVRRLPAGTGRETQRSVAVLLPSEGMEFDMVTMRMRMGVHRLVKATSFTIRGGEIVAVSTRAVRTEHR